MGILDEQCLNKTNKRDETLKLYSSKPLYLFFISHTFCPLIKQSECMTVYGSQDLKVVFPFLLCIKVVRSHQNYASLIYLNIDRLAILDFKKITTLLSLEVMTTWGNKDEVNITSATFKTGRDWLPKTQKPKKVIGQSLCLSHWQQSNQIWSLTLTLSNSSFLPLLFNCIK